MKKKWLAMLLAVVTAVSLLPGTAFAAGPGRGAYDRLSPLNSGSGGEFSVSVTGTQAYAYAYEVAEQVNLLRAELGLSQLVIDPVLMETAMQRAVECAVYYSSSHTRPNGAQCFTAFPNRSRTYMAENIAAGYATPAAVMNGWTNSSGHYANMTSTSINAFGVGCFCVNGTYYWAQCFTGGAYSSSSSRLSDRTATVTMPVIGENLSLSAGAGSVSLRVGESCQLPVYHRNPGFYNTAAALSGISGAVLSAGANLVKLDSDTLTVTGAAAGSGTVTLSLPDGSALSFAVQVTEQFSDVPAGQYYADAVVWAAGNGYVAGYGDGTFRPDVTCTEVQILTFLWHAEGSPASGVSAPFAASLPDYYRGAVNWAYGKGMIDALFEPNTPCTRGSTVNYLWQVLGSQRGAPAGGFTDVSADNAAVNWAVKEGIIGGYGDGTFRPDVTCSRGMIATLLYQSYVPGPNAK